MLSRHRRPQARHEKRPTDMAVQQVGGLVLTIKDANGTDTRPQYRAHAAMPVQRLKHELSVLSASPFVDGDELRVVSSSPMQSRPLDSMEETLGRTVAHGLSLTPRVLRILRIPSGQAELILYVTPGMGQKQAVP